MEESKQKAKIFLEENTYTFIKTYGNSYYNGYIIKLKEEYILFKDDKLGEFPILYSDIKLIAPSRTNGSGNNE